MKKRTTLQIVLIVEAITTMQAIAIGNLRPIGTTTIRPIPMVTIPVAQHSNIILDTLF